MTFRRMKPSEKKYLLVLFLIIVLGLALRFTGLRFGFPYLFHPDEPTVLRKVGQFYRGDLNPHWFSMPSLYLYLVYFSSRVYSLLSGISFSAGANRFTLSLIGRFWSALLGGATVGVLFLVGRRLYGWKTGLGAAFLLAVLPLHLLHSHYATVDIPVTFLVLLAFLFSVLVWREGKWRWYLLAGFSAGLAAGSKYNGGLVLIPLLTAHLLRVAPGFHRDNSYPRILIPPLAALGAVMIAFFLTTPYILREPATLFRDLKSQSHYLISYGHGPIFIRTSPGWLYNLLNPFYYAGGGVFWVMALAGLAAAAWKHTKSDLLVFSWIVPYYILISIPNVKFSRFFIPLLPFLALLAARLLEFPLPRPRWRKPAAALLGLGCFWLLLSALAYTRLLARPDVRIETLAWIDGNIPPGSRIGLVRTETGLIFLDDPPFKIPNRRFDIERYPRLLPALQARPDYIIATQFDYRQILRLKAAYDQKRCDRWKKFFSGRLRYRKRKVFDEPPAIFGIKFGGSFPPHDMLYNRPLITIMAAKPGD